MTRSKSSVKYSRPLSISLLGNDKNNLESSTYVSTLHVLQVDARSLMYKLKSNTNTDTDTNTITNTITITNTNTTPTKNTGLWLAV